jgi:hypothetical protein
MVWRITGAVEVGLMAAADDDAQSFGTTASST